MAHIDLPEFEEMTPEIQDKARPSPKDCPKILKSEIDALKAFGYTDVQIIEAVAITGYFNYINTHSNVFGLGQ